MESLGNIYVIGSNIDVKKNSKNGNFLSISLARHTCLVLFIFFGPISIVGHDEAHGKRKRLLIRIRMRNSAEGSTVRHG